MQNKSKNQNRCARQRGFSLIELLIVVAIILIIAAIAIPSLLRAKISANEASAVNSVRSYTTGNVTYNSICPEIGYPATLADLGPGGGTCVGGANIVDNILGVASPTKAGYSFTYVPTVGTGGANVSYTINANPLVPGMTGQRGFYSDQTGTIRYALSGSATPASSAL